MRFSSEKGHKCRHSCGSGNNTLRIRLAGSGVWSRHAGMAGHRTAPETLTRPFRFTSLTHTARTIGRTALATTLLLLPLNHLAAQDLPAIVAEATMDINHAGEADSIAIVLREGTLEQDAEPWCGAGLKHVGRFDLVVTVDETRRVFSLNELLLPGKPDADLWFRAAPYEEGRSAKPRRWSIRHDDYNGDGQPDFTLGQYGGCNGWYYRILTVKETGRVSRLPFECECHSELFVNSQQNSVTLTRTDAGFSVSYYSNAKGRFSDSFRWLEGRGLFVLKARKRMEWR